MDEKFLGGELNRALETENSGFCRVVSRSQTEFCNFVAAVMKFGLVVWKILLEIHQQHIPATFEEDSLLMLSLLQYVAGMYPVD